MSNLLRIVTALALAIGAIRAQDPGAVFEKAPPDVDAALRARVNEFYGYFISGKFRLADALVAEDSKDTFFAADKHRFNGCTIGTITYSDNFTKAKVVTTCDTEYFFAANRFPVKLPVVSMWKIEDGQWFWCVLPLSEQNTYNSPFGPVPKPTGDQTGTEPANAPAVSIPDPATVLAQVRNGVRIDKHSVDFNGAKASKEEIHVKNTLPGRATVIAEYSGIPGFSVTPAKAELSAGQEVTMVFAFNPKDPKVNCKECLANPQNRAAGTVTLRVDPTGQALPVQINFVTPRS